MINQKLYGCLDFNQSCSQYLKSGYTELNVSTPLGTRIFQKSTGDEVIRVGQDEGYDIFASSIRNGTLSLINVVNIHDHYRVNRPGGSMYTITEMECLDELNTQEISKLENWRVTIIGKLNQAGNASDPYGLLNDFIILNSFIQNNQALNLSHDYMQSKNIMKRINKFIIIDPFA